MKNSILKKILLPVLGICSYAVFTSNAQTVMTSTTSPEVKPSKVNCSLNGIWLQGLPVLRACENGIFVGVLAGGVNNTTDNAYFGYKAGEQNQNGRFNVALGHTAGYRSTGNRNTFVGSTSGTSLNTGDSNTALGDSADIQNGLAYASAIGAGSAADQNNQLMLGRPADKVVIPGFLELRNLGSITPSPRALPLCLNTSGNQTNLVTLCQIGPPTKTPSSRRYKTIIRPFSGGLAIISRLEPATFNWKEDNKADIGLIAEDVDAVEPQLVYRNAGGTIEGVDYNHVQIVSINAIKELKSQVDVQKRENQDLNETVRIQQIRLEDQRKTLEQLILLICANNASAGVCKNTR